MKTMDNERIYGKMPERIDMVVQGALAGEARPARSRRLSVVLVALVLMLALACTALAVTLTRSAQSEATQRAREALYDAYGFTPQTLGLFSPYAEAGRDGYEVIFTPIKYAKQLGSYEVALPEEGATEVRWTYDDADLTAMEGGGLDSAIWGPAQIERALALDEAYMAKLVEMRERAGGYDAWTLEERAELDAMLADAGYHERGTSVNSLPLEEHMQPEAAVALARETFTREFGLEDEALDAYQQVLYFRHNTADDAYSYQVNYSRVPEAFQDASDNEREISRETYYMTIDAATGEPVYYGWVGPPEAARLPDGPLQNRKAAVLSFMNARAFDLLGHEEKALLAARLAETSYGRELLSDLHYEIPRAEDIDEAAALDMALAAIEAKYGLTREMVDAFMTVQMSYQQVAGYPAWVLAMREDFTDEVVSRYRGKIGKYRVVIAAETGEVRVVRWSLDGLPQTAYDDANWPEAPLLWDADIFARALALRDAVDALAAEYPGQTRWDNETYLQRWNTLYREAGYDRTAYDLAVPGPEDLTREAAVEVAKEAFCETFDKTRAEIDTYRVAHVLFSVADPERAVWRIDLYGTQVGVEDTYRAVLDGRTGEILEIEYVAQGNG